MDLVTNFMNKRAHNLIQSQYPTKYRKQTNKRLIIFFNYKIDNLNDFILNYKSLNYFFIIDILIT